MGGLAMCYICGGYAESGCSIGKQRYLDDPSIYRCRKCYEREMQEEEEAKQEQEKSSELAQLVRDGMEEFSTTISKAIDVIIEEPKYNPDKDQLKIYWAQYNWLRGIVIPNQVYYYYKNLTKFYVKDLPEIWKKNISEDLFDQEVYIVKDETRKRFYKTLLNILNERFVRRQLDLVNPALDNRGAFYMSSQRLKGDIDIAGSPLQQQINTDGAIQTFCEKLTDFFNVPYWGYVMDKLNMKSKARAVAYDLDLKGTLLDVNTIDEFTNEAFFILVCEKEQILLETMRGLRALGYRRGWLGIVTQGYATTSVVRILMDYKLNVHDKFVVLVLHDWDMNGLKILFDIIRYFPAESAGLNLELINMYNIEKSVLLEVYRGKSSKDGKAPNAQLTGAKNMLNDLLERKFINNEQYTRFDHLIDECKEARAELNALMAYRADEDPTANPCMDYCNYIEHLLENFDRVFDLNRYDIPKWGQYTWDDIGKPEIYYAKPSFINTMKDEIVNLLTEKIDEYLEEYDNEDFWRDMVSDIMDAAEKHAKDATKRKMKILEGHQDVMKEENEEYDGSLKKVRTYLDKQSKELMGIRNKKHSFLIKFFEKINDAIELKIKESDEYSKVETSLTGLKENIEEILKDLDLEKIDEEDPDTKKEEIKVEIKESQFQCNDCKKIFEKDQLKVFNNSRLCPECLGDRIVGYRCNKCRRTFHKTEIITTEEGHQYCWPCFEEISEED